MSNTHSFDSHIDELIQLLKRHDVSSQVIEDFLDKHQGTEYLGELQCVLDVKELLDIGLLRYD